MVPPLVVVELLFTVVFAAADDELGLLVFGLVLLLEIVELGGLVEVALPDVVLFGGLSRGTTLMLCHDPDVSV